MRAMQIERQRKSRRRFLTSGLAGVCALIPIASIASATKKESAEMNLVHLIKALRSIGKSICSDAADRLAQTTDVKAGFDLHLRRAELNEDDARVLATGLQRPAADNELVLRSFSASFNPELGDNGAAALIEAFPEAITELGLVGCSIGDAGGRAILKWAQTAPRLRMVCIEGNLFSDGMRAKLNDLTYQGRQVLVVV